MMDVNRANLPVGSQQIGGGSSEAGGSSLQSGRKFSKLINEMTSKAPISAAKNSGPIVQLASDQLRSALEQARFDVEYMNSADDGLLAEETDHQPGINGNPANGDSANLMAVMTGPVSLMISTQLNVTSQLQECGSIDLEQSNVDVKQSISGIGFLESCVRTQAHPSNEENKPFSLENDQSESSMRELLDNAAALSFDELNENAHTKVRQFGAGEAQAAEMSGSADEAASPANSSAPIKIHISQIATYFPAIIAEGLPAQGFESSERLEDRNFIEAQRVDQWMNEASDRSDRVRVLRFELEPAELGGMMVKMRVRENGVEIVIEAKSASTTNLLNHARDALSSAIEHKGMSLQVFDVTTQTESSGPRSSQGEGFGTHNGAGNARENQDQGAFYRDGQPQREQRRDGAFKQGMRLNEIEDAPIDFPTGVIL